jgi:hypothetical protein
MTIAGSGIYSFAGASIQSPCDNAESKGLPGCTGTGLFGGLFKPAAGTTGLTAIQNTIATIGTFLIGIIAAISVIFLILGAYNMVSDNGDGKSFAAGKSRIVNAIIGLVVALLAFAIINVVISVVK